MDTNSIKDVETVHAAVHTAESFNPKTVRTIKWKADLTLLPVLSFAYLLNSLDRSNLSNAHTAGLVTDLGMHGTQFNDVLNYYQIPFIALGPLFTLATKLFGARYTLSASLVIFGVASLATGFVKTFGQLVACRVIVGAAESGFLGSAIYYLSVWYTRRELASRIGFFYAALVASSAFGGLISYGAFQIPNRKYFVWSYLFFIEGALTTLWGFLVLYFLPTSVQSTQMLTQEEKDVAIMRLEQDSVQNFDKEFSWSEAFSEFRTPHGWIRCLLSFVSGEILTSNANFLSMVVSRLGLGTVDTQLYTVAPALVGAVTLFAWSKSSDYFNERGFHGAAASIVSLIGYVILYAIDETNTAVLYFAIFLCTIGAYPNTPIGSAWAVANIPNLNARAALVGMKVAIGNCSGFLSNSMYLDYEAPRYVTSLRVNIAFCILLTAMLLTYTIWMRWENRCRDKNQGAEGSYSTGDVTGTRDPRFRFQT